MPDLIKKQTRLRNERMDFLERSCLMMDGSHGQHITYNILNSKRNQKDDQSRISAAR